MSEAVLQTHTEHLLTGITGMTCSACATRLEKALQRAPGVQKATVNFATEQADISFDADATSAATVAGVIAKAGFGVNETAFTFDIVGMTDCLPVRVNGRCKLPPGDDRARHTAFAQPFAALPQGVQVAPVPVDEQDMGGAVFQQVITDIDEHIVQGFFG